jgi:N-acetylmuramoyl-L-alanine amidase
MAALILGLSEFVGLRESDVVLDVSLQVAALLRARGVDVRLTRTSEIDVDLPPRVSLGQSIRGHSFHQHSCQCLEHETAGCEWD